MIKLPFSPLPPWLMETLTQRVIFVGDKISRGMPKLEEYLYQAELDITPREYAAAAFVTAVFYGFMAFVVFFFLNIFLELGMEMLVVLIPFAFFGLMMFSGLFYPKTLTTKRTRELEKDLIPATRHMLIELKSGVPLFQALMAISVGYGEVSKEFKMIVKEISTGVKETVALENSTRRNPSFQFRRVVWQISNALKAGSEVAGALEVIIEDLSREQVIAIRRYGQELNPWTMLYMVGAVIIPSLGLTFLVVITSFSGTMIPKMIFPLIIGALFGFQIFFLNFVKTKRPPI
jgi:flagellar protein FlaJ